MNSTDQSPPVRLAVVVSHPVQYYAPWFQLLARQPDLRLKVFYLWDFGITNQHDQTFGRSLQWDVDLLQGYEHTFVPNTSRQPGTKTFGGLRNPALIPLLGQWQPDAILAYGYGWSSMLSLPIKWRGAPLILRGDTHDLGISAPNTVKRRLRDLFLRWLFRRYEAFACVGQANRRFLAQRGVPDHRLFHVPHAVDNDRFGSASKEAAQAWRRQNGIPSHHLVILFAGKFETKKRPDLLARAFKSARLNDCTLVFIGDGALAPLIDEILPAPAAMKRLGFHNQTEMPAALRAADVLVLPSQGSGETWGLIVNEAMACGTPAIVSDHVGCAEDLVIPNETGWIFPAGSETALTQTLQTASHCLRADPEKFQTATRQRVARYSYEQATAGLRTLLSSVVAKQTTRSESS